MRYLATQTFDIALKFLLNLHSPFVNSAAGIYITMLQYFERVFSFKIIVMKMDSMKLHLVKGTVSRDFKFVFSHQTSPPKIADSHPKCCPETAANSPRYSSFHFNVDTSE